MTRVMMGKKLFSLAAVLLLAACAEQRELDAVPRDMGNFRLGHNIVIADNAQISPVSRAATDEEWEEALTQAIDTRLGGYDGEGLFHLGVSVDAYALAPAGVPLVFSPKSVLVIGVNIWDNSTREKLTDEPVRFNVFEGTTSETVIGSGLTRGKEEQIAILSQNAAAVIQDWLLENPQWFEWDNVDASDVAEVAQSTPPGDALVTE